MKKNDTTKNSSLDISTTKDTRVLYQKYRPADFSEVRGQDHIVSVLKASIASGNISHAYLFSGPRGTGKTSLARIMARDLGIADHDTYEIDAASHRQVADIDELREQVRTMPYDSPYKMIILDEVHMLSNHAFNALLKTLEEPPRHALFILATTEPEKVPETIHSRCQVFSLHQPNRTVLHDMILDVAKKEKIALEESGADMIALVADGSFRDALSTLQKVAVLGRDGKITGEEVSRVTGAPSRELIESLVQAISKRDIETILETLEKARQQSIDPYFLGDLLLLALQRILLIRFSSRSHTRLKKELGDEQFDSLSVYRGAEGKEINAEIVHRILTAQIECTNLRTSYAPLELALLQLFCDTSKIT